MVVYNAGAKELTAKIVYYGPGLGGKTTNLQFLHRRLEPTSVGNLLALAADAERTIYFDLLPVELGDLKGYRIRFQVATVPGQSPYNETRRLVLRGVDGLVFVADSRWSMLPKNLESLQNLRENLAVEGLDFQKLPVVIQFNKRDLPDILGVEALQEGLGLTGLPSTEAVATEGKGVIETFKLVSKLTFVEIVRRLQKREIGPGRSRESGRLVAWKDKIVTAAAPDEGAADSSVRTGAIAVPGSTGGDGSSVLKAVPPSPVEADPFPQAARRSIEDTNPAFRERPRPSSAPPPESAGPAAPIPLREPAPGPPRREPAREPPAPPPPAEEFRETVESLRSRIERLENSERDSSRARDESAMAFADLRTRLDRLDEADQESTQSRGNVEAAVARLRDELTESRTIAADAVTRNEALLSEIERAAEARRGLAETIEERTRSVETASAELHRGLEARMDRAEQLLEDFSVRAIQESAGHREKLEGLDRRLSGFLERADAGDAERDRLRSELAEELEALAEIVRRSR